MLRPLNILLIFIAISISQAFANEPTQETAPQIEGEALATSPDEAAHKGMTLEKMGKIIRALDKEAKIQGPLFKLTVAEVEVTIITDPKNNRMRAFVPIQSLDGVNQQLLYRMLQANFDSALDARYAIARGYILSAFIHPLKELNKDQLIAGVGQVVNLVKTYGTAFTSGAMTFGGGDSRNLHRKLIDELLKKGEEI